jgi:hypothetical protein
MSGIVDCIRITGRFDLPAAFLIEHNVPAFRLVRLLHAFHPHGSASVPKRQDAEVRRRSLRGQ